MADTASLQQQLTEKFSNFDLTASIALGELTVEIPKQYLHEFCLALRDSSDFKFEQLIDLCGVDYLEYGVTEWATEDTTLTGFSRGVEKTQSKYVKWDKPRFAVVYHLLSITHNQRLRLRVFTDGEPPMVDSVVDIWNVANFFEREAFDLFGIIFKNHPDLRRILTDYGFIGHPFRKDFPLIGQVEPRYDAAQGRVIYEPVSIKPRTLVPKVIRKDQRYSGTDKANLE